MRTSRFVAAKLTFEVTDILPAWFFASLEGVPERTSMRIVFGRVVRRQG